MPNNTQRNYNCFKWSKIKGGLITRVWKIKKMGLEKYNVQILMYPIVVILGTPSYLAEEECAKKIHI